MVYGMHVGDSSPREDNGAGLEPFIYRRVMCDVSQVSPKQDIIFMITKMGYLFMFDIHTGKALYRAKISEQTIFVTTTQVPLLLFLSWL